MAAPEFAADNVTPSKIKNMINIIVKYLKLQVCADPEVKDPHWGQRNFCLFLFLKEINTIKLQIKSHVLVNKYKNASG